MSSIQFLGLANMSFYSILRKISGLSKIHDSIVELVGPLQDGQLLIDVGCGRGALLHDMYNRYGEGPKYVGIDPEESKLVVARKYLSQTSIIIKRAFADTLPVVPNSCDRVVCSLVFHHIPKESQDKSFLEMFNALKPGGKMIITEFDKPRGLGLLIVPFNSCHKSSNGLVNWIKAKTLEHGGRVSDEKFQFGYITHLTIEK